MERLFPCFSILFWQGKKTTYETVVHWVAGAFESNLVWRISFSLLVVLYRMLLAPYYLTFRFCKYSRQYIAFEWSRPPLYVVG